MAEPEENNEELEATAATEVANENAAAVDEESLAEADAEEEGGTVIRDTDIVFDCPHCGHNLAIDYRGAGLQIECVNCGESVLVPIPDGMKIDDLDIEPGARIAELELELRGVTMRSDSLRALLESFAIQLEELKELSRNEVKLRDKSAALIGRLAGDISATIGDTAHSEMLNGVDGTVSDAE